MKRNMMSKHRIWYVVAAFVLVLGCLAATALTVTTLASYPSLIKEAYGDPLQKVEVPGGSEIELSRKGAYGLYYETSYMPTGGPPELNCRMISNTTGDEIPLVSDYVPTNRYELKEGRVGVLILSTTIERPGLHRLSCTHPNGNESPNDVLAIGPNYFFEFLRVAWKMGSSLLGVAAILVGSGLLSIGFAAFVFYQSRRKLQIGGDWMTNEASR